MPVPIALSLDFNEQREIARFNDFPPALQQALIARLGPIEQKMLARVQSAVPRRTGKLLSEIQGFLDSGDNWVRARVRVVVDKSAGRGPRGNYDSGKAAALEYGARTTAHVRSFRRRRGEQVAAYQRRVTIAARNYLRGPFAATRAEAEAAIRAAIADVTKNG
jgi:hypothetical protein